MSVADTDAGGPNGGHEASPGLTANVAVTRPPGPPKPVVPGTSEAVPAECARGLDRERAHAPVGRHGVGLHAAGERERGRGLRR